MYYQPATQRQSHQAIDVPSICFNVTHQKEKATGCQLMVVSDLGEGWLLAVPYVIVEFKDDGARQQAQGQQRGQTCHKGILAKGLAGQNSCHPGVWYNCVSK